MNNLELRHYDGVFTQIIYMNGMIFDKSSKIHQPIHKPIKADEYRLNPRFTGRCIGFGYSDFGSC